MSEFLYHALGICGEHSHPNLINLSLIALVGFVSVKVIRKQFKTN
jgi:hypothetical protein